MVVVCSRGYVFAQSRLPAAASGGPGAASKVLYSREFRPEPSEEEESEEHENDVKVEGFVSTVDRGCGAGLDIHSDPHTLEHFLDVRSACAILRRLTGN